MGWREVVKSVEAAQVRGEKQMPPFNASMKTLTQHNSDDAALFEDLGLSGEQFRVLSKNLPVGLALHKVVYDKKDVPVDAVTLEVNPEYEKTLGITREQLIGRQMVGFLRKGDSPVDWIAIYGRVAAKGIAEYLEVQYPLNQHYYEAYVFSPKKGYCFSSLRDVTKQHEQTLKELMERKKAEQKLISTEKRYRRLYQTTQDGIMARDLQGKIIDCNQAYAKMLGYTKKELKRLTVKQLLPERWHEQIEKGASKVMQTGRSIVFEREYTRKDGSVFPASVRTWQLTDGKGKATEIWSIVRDISEQKALQKNLEEHAGVLEQIIDDRTKQLKNTERLAAIGQTAGMVGHDLRNPLQTIIGELYLAKNEVDSLPQGEAKNNLQESIHVIEEQAIYMDKIVSDLQAFVQPVRIDKKPVNLKELITSVLEAVVIPHNVSMQTQTQKIFPEIKADPQLLKRVLINLVTNAVQAMPNGGRLNLTAHVNSKGKVSITVQDTGVGIPDRIKNQIFTPLFTTKPRGQGFGLAVCKRVIEAHGGTISFESTTDKGTKFTVEFPAS
jgi:PAS domain S-box-containing protein